MPHPPDPGLGAVAPLSLLIFELAPKSSLHYPVWDRNDTQNNPALFLHAYQAAWINNIRSMAFMNVTNLRNLSDPNSYPFQYLKFTVGKTFPLMYNDSIVGIEQILQPNALS